MVKIGIFGAAGRMGRNLVTAVAAHPDASLAAALELAASDKLGLDAGMLAGIASAGIAVSADPDAGAAASDVLIDFTHRDALADNLARALAAGRAFVVGTTGLAEAEYRLLAGAAREIPIVADKNFSYGITVLTRLVREAARYLDRGFDLEIVETHHHFKKDAPSGTALKLAEAAAKAWGRDLAASASHGRSGMVGERPAGEIGLHAVRGGDVVGEHVVSFFGEGERVELVHKASSRMTFAVGAVRAAVWAAGRPPGLYGMEDVLGF